MSTNEKWGDGKVAPRKIAPCNGISSKHLSLFIRLSRLCTVVTKHKVTIKPGIHLEKSNNKNNAVQFKACITMQVNLLRFSVISDMLRLLWKFQECNRCFHDFKVATRFYVFKWKNKTKILQKQKKTWCIIYLFIYKNK